MDDESGTLFTVQSKRKVKRSPKGDGEAASWLSWPLGGPA